MRLSYHSSLTSIIGSDTSWATHVTTHTYFRNVQLWGSSSPSNLTGSLVSDASATHKSSLTLGVSLLIVVLATFAWA